MKETEFIGQNKEKWNELENLLESDRKDPDRLTNLFIETTDDLSFSRTYYPNRSVRVYLNGIAQQVFQIIYRNKGKEKGAFRKFWEEDIPEAMWFARNPFLYSFLIFTVGFCIGLYSSIHYPGFARMILGDYYVEMTEANIQKGDPLAVYGNASQIEMFLQIAWNNIRILFYTYALGILFGLGTIYIVLYNSIMVGTFIYFFIERDLFGPCFYGVMLHGTIELSMIIIGGAAGLTLGKGLVFPGTYSRLQGLLISARQSIKILLAASIFLVVAAFIESFATRYTGMPDFIRGMVILLSFGIVVGYFVIYPRYKFRKSNHRPKSEEEVWSRSPGFSAIHEIKANGKIFTEIFSVYPRLWKRVIATAVVVSAGLLALYYALTTGGEGILMANHDMHYLPWFIRAIWIWGDYGWVFNYGFFPPLFFLHAIVLGFLITFFSTAIFRAIHGTGTKPGKFFRQWLSSSLISIFVLLPLLLPAGLSFLLLIFFWPLLTFVAACSFQENKFMAFGRSFRLLSGSFWKMIGLFFSCLGVQWLVLMVSSAPILYLLLEIVDMNVSDSLSGAERIAEGMFAIVMLFAMISLMPISFIASHFFYFSSLEVKEAAHLRSQIQEIGFKKRAYGLEKES